jgi:hypothetical protein
MHPGLSSYVDRLERNGRRIAHHELRLRLRRRDDDPDGLRRDAPEQQLDGDRTLRASILVFFSLQRYFPRGLPAGSTKS